MSFLKRSLKQRLPSDLPADRCLTAVTAQKKFSCPSCGGEAQWNPAKKALICPFCGTTSPAQAELDRHGRGSQIVEHDLVAALRGIPDSAARLAGGQNFRQMPELPGHFRL